MDKKYKALRFFVDCINATGGVAVQSNGFRAPVADSTWTDLGEAYMYACDALGVEPQVRTETNDEESVA